MEHCTGKPSNERETPAFGGDSIEQAMRLRSRGTIEQLAKSAHVGKQRPGHCLGTTERTLARGPPRAGCRGRDSSRPMGRAPVAQRNLSCL
jgi:hypothetical protein